VLRVEDEALEELTSLRRRLLDALYAHNHVRAGGSKAG